MRVTTPVVFAHAKDDTSINEAIMSVDFHPSSSIMVSGGSFHKEVVLWAAKPETAALTFLAALLKPDSGVTQRSAMVVRFSPDGKSLFCALDDNCLYLLTPKRGLEWENVTTHEMVVARALRNSKQVGEHTVVGHTKECSDACWTHDSRFFATSSVDGTVVIWNAKTCEFVKKLNEHVHYVLGVAFNADSTLLATQSNDRTVKLYKFDSSTGQASYEATMQRPKLFMDESLSAFSRRLCFGGSRLLVAPCGLLAAKDAATPATPATHVFLTGTTRSLKRDVTTPWVSLHGHAKPSIAVRFHPAEFRVLPRGPKCWTAREDETDAEARRVFAVATTDTVLIYDTQHAAPIGVVENLHNAALTDLAWCPAKSFGQVDLLVVSSIDGFFSLVRFEPDELGERVRPLEAESDPEQTREDVEEQGQSSQQQQQQVEEVEVSTVEPEVKRVKTVPEDLVGPAPGAFPTDQSNASVASATTTKRRITPVKIVEVAEAPSAAAPVVHVLVPRKKVLPPETTTPSAPSS